MTLLADRLLAIHRSLDGGGFEHAFGGAIALAYWTLDPRGTSDIDVNIFIDAADCEPALRALPEEVAYDEGAIAAIVRDGQRRLFWDETPVDVFFTIVPIHDQAARNRRTVPFAGTEIPVLGPLELAHFKLLFNRYKDWGDIEAMIEAETLDADALREQLIELIGNDDERLGRLAELVAAHGRSS